MNDKLKIILKEYTIITLSILAMAIGIYFFKFPYNFAFGGVTGYATMIGALTNLTATRFSNIANMVLLVVGFICIGKSFGIKTIYASIELTIILELLERFVPLSGPLTDQPFLEMVLAVSIPSVATGILFNIGASSGGTDILAMILKKYTKSNELGIMFIAVDVLAVIMSFFVFDIKTGLFSALGLVGKSFIIDGAIESINLCKCFTIVCDTPEPICEYIINNLHRSATIYEAKGAFAHNKKTIILTTMKRSQAVKLRNYIKRIDPSSFMMITNSSEIIGKGFQNV
jgi:putative membrane protein